MSTLEMEPVLVLKDGYAEHLYEWVRICEMVKEIETGITASNFTDLALQRHRELFPEKYRRW